MQYGSDAMKQATVESSARYPGVVSEDGLVRYSNTTGVSIGAGGVQKIKYGGSRIDLDAICGAGGPRGTGCEFGTGAEETLFIGSGTRLREVMAAQASPLGGVQGGGGQLFGVPYPPGSMADCLVEAFAPAHDFLNSGMWYDTQGNLRQLSGPAAALGEVVNATNVLLAAPFAVAPLVPPGAIETALGRRRP